MPQLVILNNSSSALTIKVKAADYDVVSISTLQHDTKHLLDAATCFSGLSIVRPSQSCFASIALTIEGRIKALLTSNDVSGRVHAASEGSDRHFMHAHTCAESCNCKYCTD